MFDQLGNLNLHHPTLMLSGFLLFGIHTQIDAFISCILGKASRKNI